MHWTQRLKRENQQLKTRNAQLQKELGSRVKGTLLKVDPFADLKAAIAEDVREVDANTVANALLNRICIPHNCREDVFIMEEGRSVRGQPFRLTDRHYKVVSRDMLARILDETKVDALEYEAQAFDCEDFARRLVSRAVSLGINSVGRVMSWSGEHAFNIAIVQRGDGVEVVFIESQTDQIVTVLEGNYDLSNALIVIS